MTSTLSPSGTPPTSTAPSPVETPPPPRTGRPRPRHLALGALLIATAGLYLWGLSASGWANGFYSAAAQAAGTSWKAWFFGSSDAANWITVDKTPAALWVDGLAVRIFGLSSWSVLVPQALTGVGSVALLYASVRRTTKSTGAALVAGAALALTPVAVLIFRFNNPDALLTLLLTGAAYATLRAVERGGTRWLVLAGALVGFGFLTKMLQAFLVLPAFALVWLVVAPVGIGRRLRGLAAASVALVLSAGWWVLAVELWPAADRPFIGGSQTNSVLDLVFGYNGFGRLTGDEVGSVGGGAGRGGGWGETGLTRLFGSEFGGGAAWLLPAALLLVVVLAWWTRRAPRTDAVRAATLVWGGWLLVTGLTFSLMAGIIHPYYVVVLAPAIAGLVGVGGAVLWRDRATPAARAGMAALVAVTAAWAFVLLRRTPTWQPWVAWTVLGAGLLAAVGLLVVHRGPRLARAAVLTAAVVAGLLGPAGYSVATAAQTHTGAIPSAGPAGAGFGGTGGGRGGPGGRPGGAGFGPGGGFTPGGAAAGGTGGTAGGPVSGTGTSGGTTTRPGGFGGRGGPGGILGSPTPSAALAALLELDASSYTWAAAAVGSNSAAGYQLATQLPVMAVGGFNGTDPSPTLAQFQQLVIEKKIHWFVGGAGSDSTQSGGSDAAQQIAAWVQATFPARTVGGTTVYDLS